MTKTETIVMVFGWLLGMLFGAGLTHSASKSTMPTCPVSEGRAVTIEYYRDGSMVCTYQQLPAGVKTYKEKH